MRQALFDRALVALRDLLLVTPDDQVLILDDRSLSRGLVDSFVAASAALGTNAVVVAYAPVHEISLLGYAVFGGASLYDDTLLAPKPVVDAMAASDAIVVLNSDLELLFDLRLREVAKAARIGWLPYTSEDTFIRTMAQGVAEADELQDLTLRVAEAVRGAREVSITSDAGTDLRLGLGEYRVNAGTWYGADGPGSPGMKFWPAGQVGTIPNAGSAEGVLVIDRSVAAPQFRPLTESIRLNVENGNVTSIEGGVEARLLDRFLRGLGDDGRAYHVTELGIGTNWRCQQTGVEASTDTKTLAGVSIALGADSHMGGETRAGSHNDMTMSCVSLFLDGKPLIDDGVFAFDK